MIINDEAMHAEIVSDMKERYNYTDAKAIAFASEYGDRIVDSMWSAYSDSLQYNMRMSNEE